MRTVWVALIVIVLVASIFLPLSYLEFANQNAPQNSDVYFGVTFGGNTTAQAEQLINKVKDYTNLFVVDSWALNTINETINGTALTTVCDYAVNNGLNIIVYFSYISHIIYPWQFQWVQQAKEQYSDRLLGIYFYDEPGGKQIDLGTWNNDTSVYANVTTYSQAADAFIGSVSSQQSLKDLKNLGISAFTADYALYWYDYLAGYDCVFAELYGSSQNAKIQQIALCRGAANVQGKQWGAILTWSEDEPPYLENGTVLLQDMFMAYNAGAKYIVLFNYPTYPDTNPYGILTDDHFDAMSAFWNKIQNNDRITFASEHAEIAFVLPEHYGWGMRWQNDKIWGLWNSDDLAPIIWDKLNQEAGEYELRLDIVYADSAFNLTQTYPTIHYWNT